MAHDLRCAGVHGQLQQVVGPEAAQRHSSQLQGDRHHVPHRHQHPLEPPVQPALRKREEHVQEQHGHDDVERLPDGVRDVVLGPRERDQEHQEARNDHQRAEAARRPSGPGDKSSEDVRNRDPVRQERDHERLAQLGPDRGVRQRQGKRNGGDRAAGDPNRPQHSRPRRPRSTDFGWRRCQRRYCRRSSLTRGRRRLLDGTSQAQSHTGRATDADERRRHPADTPRASR